RSAPLSSATLWRDSLAELDRAVGEGSLAGAPDAGVRAVARAATDLAALVREVDGAVELPLGPFHGDWVPWNLGWSGRTLWAWDPVAAQASGRHAPVCPLEVVVVRDGTPAVPLRVELPAQVRLRQVPNTPTPGLPGARNSGVLAAGHELVAFCDDDDEWLPGK